ncbi:TonB-dependent receptor [Porphyromonas pogonae]|uniref:TonB-dependent receptor n=1 Tax=Porphyromonas pogonae TaxID=867595 RepID=UPI002E7651C6|nr:TonB-dependent receptor [Porphyromonas pogonae]
MNKIRYNLYKGVAMMSLLLCSSVLLQAQQLFLRGVVRDAQTGDALVGASVKVENDKNGCITRDNGSYSLKMQAVKSRVTFRYMGYKSRTISVDFAGASELVHNISLAPSDRSLGEVVVTAKNEARVIHESALPVSVISASQLQGSVSSVNDVLARTAGITIRNTGGVGSASRISVRGLEGKRIGVFIDEHPIGQMQNFVTLNDIPIDMIERIEVYKGVVPNKFGGNSMGGAVNIVLKEYPPVYLDASYEIGSFNTHRFNSVMKRSLPNQGLQFGIGGGVTYSDNDYEMKLPHFDNIRVKRKHDKYTKILAGGSIKATKWWFDEVEVEPFFSKSYRQMQGIETDIREAYNQSIGCGVNTKLKKDDFLVSGLDLDFQTGIVYNYYGLKDKAMHRYDWTGKQYPPVSSYGGELGSTPADGKNKSLDFANKINVNYTLDKHQALNFNSYFSKTNLYPKDELMEKSLGFKNNYDSHMNTLTLGLAYEINAFEKKLLNSLTTKYYHYSSHSIVPIAFGIKENKVIDLNKNYFGFNEAMRYKINPNLLVKASFAYDIRIPSSEELLGDGFSVAAAPNLSPERNHSYNLGMIYHKRFTGGNTIEVEINGFYSTLTDMIRFSKSTGPMAIYENFGKMRTYGAEAEVKSDITPWLYGYVNATYQDLRDIRKLKAGSEVPNPTHGKRMPNIPYLMGNAGVEIHKQNLFGGTEQNTRIMLDGSYTHEYFYDFEVSKLQERKIPSSLLLDFALEHSFMNKRWTVTFKIKNVTNREMFSEFNFPMPGRNFGLKVRYLFK